MALTWKDEMELGYWQKAGVDHHRARMACYLWAFGHYRIPRAILEVGCGPIGGVLPLIPMAKIRVGVDPLIDEYRKHGWLPAIDGVEFHSCHLEDFQTTQRFDAIFAIDALDHGEMGFHSLSRLVELLESAGRLYVHVNMRPGWRLNALHDHGLTLDQLDAELKRLPLRELRRDIYSDDVDGTYECPTLVGVWEKI